MKFGYARLYRQLIIGGSDVILIGQKFNRLTVIKFVGRGKYSAAIWKCICDCGNETIVYQKNLKSGNTKSCGCLNNEQRIINGLSSIRHGHDRKNNVSKEYRAWQSMKSRCYNLNNVSFKNYGGRGIKVCDKWLDDFEAFLIDVGEAPSSEHSLDRINNNSHYEPGNVKWSTAEEQNQNKGGY